jgi:hypothetical protein
VTPDQFIAKWKAADLKERAAAQSHFSDLCELLDEAKPTDADPKGEWYCFERGATKKHRRGGLGGCLEARLLRLGVQEPGQKASTTRSIS